MEGFESDICFYEFLYIDVGEGDEGVRWKEDEFLYKFILDRD